MKKFLATAVFCLALVPAGTFAFHTVFPDGNVAMVMGASMPAPGPFTSCSPSAPWLETYGLDVNNMSALFPLHMFRIGTCITTTGVIYGEKLADYYGPTAPTITDTGTAYTVAWAMQQKVGDTWSPVGTFTINVLKTSLH